MKKLITIILSCISLYSYAQLYDAQWALGDGESVVDFRGQDTVTIDSLRTQIYFTTANASICDENGNLLYYTNGIKICGVDDSLLNGSDLSPCPYTDSYSYIGLNLSQPVLFIPKPGSYRYYYLFHFSNDALQDSRPGTMYYSIIDRNGNGGRGNVIEKNIPFFNGHVLRGGGMTACKHANGRDYWLIMGGSNNNTFYKFLITPNGIEGPYIQQIGPIFPLPYDVAYSKFSQDGTKYATCILGNAPLLIMDFDRCSGEFSNPDTIFNNESTDSTNPISGGASIEFSPNNRFVYVPGNTTLHQFDLWANPHGSVVLFTGDSITWFGIHFVQTAPNGKIYGSTWNGGLFALHVVSHPDLKGDSAGFVYGEQPTFTDNTMNLPNLINYRLGPLTGSGCDTIATALTESTSSAQQPRVMPNPANKFLYVEMGMQGNYQFQLLNINGQLLDTRPTPQVDYFDTEHLPAGNYLLRVIDIATGNEIGSKKIEVVH